MDLPLYKIVEPLVAASGECGGGLGAVAPAVGDEGPQHVEEVVVCFWFAGESPTTSISSSSSTSIVGSPTRSGQG